MPQKIMIIDDDEEFLAEVSEMLYLSGYETEIYTNGENALKCLAGNCQPDIVLLDLKMKRTDGYEVARVIRHELGMAHLPIISMTGCYTAEEQIERLGQYGIRTCLQKPVNPLNVIAEIELTLQRVLELKHIPTARKNNA